MLYIYELQVVKHFQGKGLGKFIVMIIEGLARKVVALVKCSSLLESIPVFHSHGHSSC